MRLKFTHYRIGDKEYTLDEPAYLKVTQIRFSGTIRLSDLPSRPLSDYGMTIDDLNRNGLRIPDYDAKTAELERRDREAAQEAEMPGVEPVSDLDDVPEPTRREALQWKDQSYPHPKLRRIPNLHKRRN